jgi:hypothetical protein
MNLQHEEPKLTSADIVTEPEHTPDLDAKEPPGKGDETHISDKQLPPLFSPETGNHFRSRWNALQIGFVDEPRRAVEQADALVAEVMQSLAKTFADERSRLETQWHQGDRVSTENLRMVLRRYRSFFLRLLSV